MEAELEHDHWESYVQCFRQTYGRAPVVYDLFCGEGGYSRGAALAGCTVVGFDIKDQPYTYGKLATSRLNGSNHFAREAIPGMHYCCRDVLSEDFRAELLSTGKIHDFAPPDVIHASPECAPYSKLNRLGKIGSSDDGSIPMVIDFLQQYALRRLSGQCTQAGSAVVPWTVENVPTAQKEMETGSTDKSSIETLCGTMFGHRVFRHRLFRSDHDVTISVSSVTTTVSIWALVHS